MVSPEFLPTETLTWVQKRLPPSRVDEDLFVVHDGEDWLQSDWWHKQRFNWNLASLVSQTSICPFCRSEFYLVWKGQKYCDPVCRDEARKKRSIQHRREKGRVHMHQKICEVCGEPFTAKRGGARTCSGACRIALHRRKKTN